MQPIMTPELLASGFTFGEGPRWRGGILWFSDMLGEAIHTADLAGSVTTIPLPGHAPSGLGFSADGTLLIASTKRRHVLACRAGDMTVVADLSDIAPADLGDMVVDDSGRIYVGSQAAERGLIARVDPDGSVVVVADGLDFPNGMVITQDRSTLIVAESVGRRLTAYSIASDGSLHSRRVWADALDGFPDGITLDVNGGVWASMTLTHQFERIVQGGDVTDRIHIGDRAAIACMLGGPDGRTLFLLSSIGANPKLLGGTKSSQVDVVTVETSRAGLP
jgi:sugar lactone lactonase YvrE